MSNGSQVGTTSRGQYVDEALKAQINSEGRENEPLLFSQGAAERRKANIGGVMAYGGDSNFGVISEDKHADIAQLKGEVDQIRNIMNQMRGSAVNSELSLQAAPPTNDDQRSSLLSILSKVRQQKLDGTGTSMPVLNAEDRESIASFLKQKNSTQQLKQMMIEEDLGADNWQPGLQMFESLVSMMSQTNTPGKRDIMSETTSQLQQHLVE